MQEVILLESIKKWRESRGMTQKFVGLSLGVSPVQVSKWEAGKTAPTIDNLVKLSRLFGVTVDDLLGLPALRKNTTPQEELVLDAFRAASPDTRSAVCAVLHVPEIEKSALIG